MRHESELSQFGIVIKPMCARNWSAQEERCSSAPELCVVWGATTPLPVGLDLPHKPGQGGTEARCRWMTLKVDRGSIFNEIEICKIMGWTDTKMMLRYASLRGEDLADRLL